MQRLLDIIIAGSALLLLSPFLVPIALILRFTGEGEIFYRQERVGFGGSVFSVYKFATMLKNSPNIGTGTVTLQGDPRVLPVGRLLRATKVNELPQLLNILNGTMGIIGPRPQTRRCFDAFPLRSQEAIKRCRPGLSGIGSIVFRNEEGLMAAATDPERFYDEMIMPYKGRLEEWYEHDQGMTAYFLLIILTGWVLVSNDISVVWKIFPAAPRPEGELARRLGLAADQ